MKRARPVDFDLSDYDAVRTSKRVSSIIIKDYELHDWFVWLCGSGDTFFGDVPVEVKLQMALSGANFHNPPKVPERFGINPEQDNAIADHLFLAFCHTPNCTTTF